MQKSKLFLSKKNPLNISHDECEKFYLSYLFPNYWFSWIIIILSFPISFIPRFFRAFFGKMLGLFIYHTNPKRRSIACTNIKLCFPDMHHSEINNLVVSYFIHLGQTIFDFPMLWWRTNKSLQSTCQIVNSHIIDEHLQKNKGVILLTPHSISLDFGGRSISKYPIISMYKPFRNRLLNWFIGKSRSKSSDNVVVFPRENFPFKRIIKALKKPNIFYYVGDEDLGSKNSTFSNFFSEQKSTIITIAKIASLSKAVVIPCINHYSVKENKYITYIGEPLKDFPSDNDLANARKINESLELLIQRDLTQYMWSLRIFQTRPDGIDYPYK